MNETVLAAGTTTTESRTQADANELARMSYSRLIRQNHCVMWMYTALYGRFGSGLPLRQSPVRRQRLAVAIAAAQAGDSRT